MVPRRRVAGPQAPPLHQISVSIYARQPPPKIYAFVVFGAWGARNTVMLKKFNSRNTVMLKTFQKFQNSGIHGRAGGRFHKIFEFLSITVFREF